MLSHIDYQWGDTRWGRKPDMEENIRDLSLMSRARDQRL